jgi:hypothetical protein
MTGCAWSGVLELDEEELLPLIKIYCAFLSKKIYVLLSNWADCTWKNNIRPKRSSMTQV